MNDSQNIPEVGPQIPRNAVSIYGQGDAMDDFPVLKAFQQYVDAEHAKAQKRMITLCIFFVVLMVAVIGVFMMLLMNISQRNSALNDQLFQFMLKDRDRQNVIVQSPGQQSDSTALLTLQKQLFDQQMKMMEEAMKTRNAQFSAPPVPESPVTQSERAEFTSQKRAHERQVKSETDKLKKAQAELKAERERIAKEKERLHQKEIDLQRRKLYPDYYASQDNVAQGGNVAASASSKPVAPASAAAPVAEDDDTDLAALDAALAAEERDAKQSATPRSDGSIRYFSDDDEDLDEFVDALGLPELQGKQKQTGEKTTGWSMPWE